MEYTFRKAVMQDFKEISLLYRAAVARMVEDGIFQWDEIYPSDEVLLEDILQEKMFLLAAEDRIAACITVNEEQEEAYLTGSWLYKEGRTAVIHRLCVHPDFQGRGIGKSTMQYAETMIKSCGYDMIRLDAFSQNLSAMKLYEGLGFRYAGEVNFRKGLFYLMEKALQA